MRGLASVLATYIGKAYLYYLAVLPAIGTVVLFSVLGEQGQLLNFLVFLVGVAAVVVYVSAMATYVPVSKSLARNFLIFVDGPIWTFLIILSDKKSATALNFIANNILIEVIGVLLGIILVLPISSLPAYDQKSVRTLVSIPLIGVLLIGILFLMRQTILWYQALAMCGAIVQSVWTYKILIDQGSVQRNAVPIVVVGLAVWVVAFFFGLSL